MEHNNETFHYTYSAKEQEELQAIRKKYAAPEEDKMETLRRLDASVSRQPTLCSITVGVVGALLLGIGMSLTMTDLGDLLGRAALPVGCAVGIVGIALVCLAYPLYGRMVRKARARIAPEILRLTDELMK